MNKSAIQAIQEYIEEFLFEPGSNWPEYYFYERTYSRWAAYEIIIRITEQKTILSVDALVRELKPPIEIIEKFINEMDDLSCIREDTHHERIFSIARDTAKEILYLFL